MKSLLRSKLSALVQRRLQIERRNGKRMVPTQRTLCLLQAPGESDRITGSVQDLSLKGIAVLTDRHYPMGSLVHILLVNASHTFSVELDLKVIRSFPTSDGQFLIAGPFLRPLLHDEVVPLLM